MNSISFSGCGWSFPYYLGIAQYLYDNYIIDNIKFIGASAGVIPALILSANINPKDFLDEIIPISYKCNGSLLGPTYYSYLLINLCEKILPEDICNRINNKLYVCLTDPLYNSFIISEFNSKNDLIDALYCSCYTLIFGKRKRKFRNKNYIDGALTNLFPKIDEKTINISIIKGVTDFNLLNSIKLLSKFYYPGNKRQILNLFIKGYTDSKLNTQIFSNLVIKNKFVNLSKL